MITLEQARAALEATPSPGVIYRAGHEGAPAEQGIITSVSATYVFVRFGSQAVSSAVYPRDLEFLAAAAGVKP